MRIGQRTVKAKIAESEKARAQYEQVKSEGKRASLPEQQRPNVFQMNVANIKYMRSATNREHCRIYIVVSSYLL